MFWMLRVDDCDYAQLPCFLLWQASAMPRRNHNEIQDWWQKDDPSSIDVFALEGKTDSKKYKPKLEYINWKRDIYSNFLLMNPGA